MSTNSKPGKPLTEVLSLRGCEEQMSPLLLFPRSVKIKFGPLNTWQLFQHCCTGPETCVQTLSGLHSGLVGKTLSKHEV